MKQEHNQLRGAQIWQANILSHLSLSKTGIVVRGNWNWSSVCEVTAKSLVGLFLWLSYQKPIIHFRCTTNNIFYKGSAVTALYDIILVQLHSKWALSHPWNSNVYYQILSYKIEGYTLPPRNIPISLYSITIQCFVLLGLRKLRMVRGLLYVN